MEWTTAEIVKEILRTLIKIEFFLLCAEFYFYAYYLQTTLGKLRHIFLKSAIFCGVLGVVGLGSTILDWMIFSDEWRNIVFLVFQAAMLGVIVFKLDRARTQAKDLTEIIHRSIEDAENRIHTEQMRLRNEQMIEEMRRARKNVIPRKITKQLNLNIQNK